ncbi:MFS transporter [Cupriavidus pinatubonensis]|uniref:Proline/betaine transporter n=1 Tax=Cupriavidus pinatubonensis TaxID=248026 RepID=A0ABM8X0Y8_9BURK|nr:MFS transporter [Cupriavidus pinatubonensis]CAG9173526.1 Proline/betaine transporter [Cupriavidus pinatubonensis]
MPLDPTTMVAPAHPPVSGQQADHPDQKKPMSKASAITAITIGGALELYDSGVYNFFATLIIPLYFPVGNPLGQLLLSFGTFGAGYLMRPLGGLVIGAYADRYGRKPAVLLSMWLMAFSALILVVTPPYAQFGIMAPILMIVARLVQGFAIGGEMGSATAMLMEYADERSRGFYTSWQTASQGIAAVFAALVALALSHTLSPDALEHWGWRVAFMIGILVIPVGQVIRRRLEETLEAPARKKAAAAGWRLMRAHWRELVASVLLMTGLAAAVHLIAYYLPNYASFQLNIPRGDAVWAGFVAAGMMVIFGPIAGLLSDRVGRRTMVWWSRIALLVMAYPAFVLINTFPSLTCLLVVVGCLAIPMAMTSPATLVLVSEVLPQRLRATGMAVTYYVAIAVFGGFAQLFSTVLIHMTGSPNAPAFYLIGCGLVSLIGLRMVPETLGRRLS